MDLVWAKKKNNQKHYFQHKRLKFRKKGYLRSTAKRVKHVKKDEAGEGHGGVAWRHQIVFHLKWNEILEGELGVSSFSQNAFAIAHLIYEDSHSADDDDGGREEDVDDDLNVDHWIFDVSRRLLNNVRVNRLDAQRLRRRPVHDDVDPENLHGVQWVGHAEDGGDGHQREGGDAPVKGEKSQLLLLILPET